MNDIYRDQMLDHFENPRHWGSLTPADGTHEDCNPLCGDCIRVDVKLSEDGQTLADAMFNGQGCIVSQASASMLLEDAVGKPIVEVTSLAPEYLLKLISLICNHQFYKFPLHLMDNYLSSYREEI